MQLQDLSFNLNTETLDLNGVKLSVEVFSLDNIYYPLKGRVSVEGNKHIFSPLCWGGNMEEDSTSASLNISKGNDVIHFDINANLNKKIREVTLKFDDLPCGELISLFDHEHEVTEYGSIYVYPEGWRSLMTPLLIFRIAEDNYLYFRSLDKEVRQKRFYLKKKANGKMIVELIFEELGPKMTNSVVVPTWEMGYAKTKEEICKKHHDFLKEAFNYLPFEKRDDVPDWLKDISLVVICHMEHWTGHIFHTYLDALEDFKKLATKIDPKRILMYVPGWEGRYYYKYGNYSPDDRLGGEKDLKAFIDGVHQLGGHVLSMVGMTLVNNELPEYEKWGKPSEFLLASGSSFNHGSVDWDASRHYDHHENSQVNPAAPGWQNKLYAEIENYTQKFGFDGVFLDIAAAWCNDARYEITKGIFELSKRLHNRFPNYLISGEGFYDGLMMAMPLFQSGHTEGVMHYHDSVYEDFFTPYAREFSHLCLGDLSYGSTGTHELGINSTDITTPYRKGLIPTLTLVNNTLKDAEEKVDEVIETSKKWAKEFLR